MHGAISIGDPTRLIPRPFTPPSFFPPPLSAACRLAASVIDPLSLNGHLELTRRTTPATCCWLPRVWNHRTDGEKRKSGCARERADAAFATCRYQQPPIRRRRHVSREQRVGATVIEISWANERFSANPGDRAAATCRSLVRQMRYLWHFAGAD